MKIYTKREPRESLIWILAKRFGWEFFELSLSNISKNDKNNSLKKWAELFEKNDWTIISFFSTELKWKTALLQNA